MRCTAGPIRTVDQAELERWGVYDDTAAPGGENSNMIARTLTMCQQKWLGTGGTPSRRFVVLGNRCTLCGGWHACSMGTRLWCWAHRELQMEACWRGRVLCPRTGIALGN